MHNLSSSSNKYDNYKYKDKTAASPGFWHPVRPVNIWQSICVLYNQVFLFLLYFFFTENVGRQLESNSIISGLSDYTMYTVPSKLHTQVVPVISLIDCLVDKEWFNSDTRGAAASYKSTMRCQGHPSSPDVCAWKIAGLSPNWGTRPLD